MTHRYGILGAAQVLRPDGGEVPLSGSRLRALLTALAAAGGRPVRAPALIDEVWEEDALPADAPAALQALVGRLRRTLGHDAVASLPGGYRLAAAPDAIDLHRFERLTAEGTEALRSGAAGNAARLLDEALSLWRGPALADLPRREGDPAVVRAERHHAEARRARLAADVALGHPEAALAGLAELAAGHPLDEPLHALRIRALRAAGRSAEALRAYEDVRRHLQNALGTDPGSELRSLYAELLVPGPGEHGPGPTPGRPPAPRAAGSAAGTTGNLRGQLSSFIGREEELDSLGDELRTRRLVTLVGAGGVGKTRLSLEGAYAARDTTDAVWVVELASVRDGANVPEAVLTVLGARETHVRGPVAGGAAPDPREPLTQLVQLCADRRMLVLLDNCEHVVDAAAALVEALLTCCPGVSVLATSREPLGVPGETVRTVDPLPRAEALRLLADRGAAARAGFRPDEDPEACEEICRRLDGLPLAVELAAARLRALSPRQIADRLDDRFRLLSTGGRTSRTALPRQQTLQAVVDWSWDLLDPAERAVLRRLSVFSGGCALEAAESVCAVGADLADGGGVAEVLASLVDKSLVVARADGAFGEMRYGLLETVAEYAGHRLDESGERYLAERRHRAAYRELARTGERRLRGRHQTAWLERLETEHDNIRAALRTAVARQEEQEALCLVLSLSWFWQLRSHRADAHHWATAVAALGPDPFGAGAPTAVPLIARCTDAAPPWSEEVLWEARRGARLLALASGDRAPGRGAPDQGATADGAREEGACADGAREDAVRADRLPPDDPTGLRAMAEAYRPGLPQNCRQPGSMWYFVRLMTGEFTGLAESVGALVEGCRAHDVGGWDLGLALLTRAKLVNEGPEAAAAALTLFERAGDPWGIAESLSARGEGYERRGAYGEAAEDYARAMETAARIGAHAQVPVFKARLASVRLDAGGSPAAEAAAERLLQEAVEESRAHAAQGMGTARLLLARRYGSTGRTQAARSQLISATREFPARTPGLVTGAVAGMHAWLDCLDGAYESAHDHVRRAVRELAGVAYLVAPELIADQFPVAAWTRARIGPAEDGALMLGAYDAHRTASPGGFSCFRPFPAGAERDIRRRAEVELRAVLAPGDYARSYGKGAQLTVAHAASAV